MMRSSWNCSLVATASEGTLKGLPGTWMGKSKNDQLKVWKQFLY